MTKSCQNCTRKFTIEPDDFAFYEKIAVPPPTLCPECRMQRRFAWRNERTLHRNVCAATGKPIISCFSKESGMTVYDRDYWWSDAWDPLAFGQEYDFSKPFFQQFDELMHRAPHPAVFNSRTVNCLYGNHVGEMKDCYMVSASWIGENCLYGVHCTNSKDLVDILTATDCNFCYEVVSSIKLYQTHFSYKAENCIDSWFLYDCKGCTSCFGCTNLRNKSYHIFNQPYSKNEYAKKLSEFNVGSYQSLETIKRRFVDLVRQSIHKYAHIINSRDCTGDNIEHGHRLSSCFDFFADTRDCKFQIYGGFKFSDSYDGYGCGANAELLYEMFDSGVNGQRQAFGGIVWGCVDVRYCHNCTGCQNCFGCIGLRSKSYCILNKQYSKGEYEQLLPRIIEHMKRTGEYGEFFPISISPFGYNETIAQDYFPLTKDQALAKGYPWREAERGKYEVTTPWDKMPDHIKDVDDGICNEIINCRGCNRPFRIIKRELDFLKRFNIALPRKCFECRHLDRFKQVNFPRLYHRTCMKQGCQNEFETTYAPDRPETIYCERCYNAEIV